MRNLTKDEIDRIVEAVKKAAGTVTTFSFGTAIDALYESELITALSTVTLDQPKIDLKCPVCDTGEENFTRNGHHIWCRKCDYEFNLTP